MEVIASEAPGLVEIIPKVFGDERGFFMESYNRRVFGKIGIDCDFVQDNHARSSSVGVLRGLHFQKPPMAQAKLVRVTAGSVFDVAVDLRKGSPTYGRWYSFTLSADNFRMLFIPRGFAHGYQTLEPDTEFMYKVDEFYSPQDDAGLRYDDPDLGIDWPIADATLSDKDRELPFLANFQTPFVFQE